MVVIRLARVGKKRQPSYRIVVQDKRQDPWSPYLENVGHYNPLTHPATVVVKQERIEHWISRGAQPSDTVWNLLVDRGIISGAKRRTIAISKKRRVKLNAKAAKKTATTVAKLEAAPAPAAA